MEKQVIIKVVDGAISVVDKVLGVAVAGGGLYVALNAFDKRFSRAMLNKAAKQAFEYGLKEGEIQEVYSIDTGIPFLVKKYVTEVNMYIVVKIKDNGLYKMRYVGSRGVTKEEAQMLVGLL